MRGNENSKVLCNLIMQLNYKRIFLLSFLLSLHSLPSASPLSGMHINAGSERLPAPVFVSEKLDGDKDSGSRVSLSDYKGKLVLLNFWATWCMPCRKEMPGMEKLWQKYRDRGFVVLAVSSDEGSPARVKTFTEKFNLSFPVLLDPEDEVGTLYNVSSLPATFLIDRQGRVVSRAVGSEDWFSEEAFILVENLLNEQ